MPPKFNFELTKMVHMEFYQVEIVRYLRLPDFM